MQYGLELPAAGIGGDARTLGELAQLAEDAGWDGVFLEDYIVWQGQMGTPTYDPWVALAAMALRTERIRLGTMVTPLARRRPWKLAHEAVTLDHLSNGRLILGVGLGDSSDVSFTAFGEATDIRQRSELLDETLDLLVGLWRGEPFSYHGAHYQVQEVTLAPTPVQRPRIPIWVGGNWPHRGVIRRAARWDGFVGGKVHADDEDWHLTPTEVATLHADIARQRPTAATPALPWDLALGGGARGPDLEHERALIQSMAAAGATWWMEYLHPDLGGGLEGMRTRIKGGPVRID
jgi:alkanesulfonate monooxygenase SsuD/methylene tetrahydromethanopterin reductase-like flavin-dependent oxidoreductase (luciferase family)